MSSASTKVSAARAALILLAIVAAVAPVPSMWIEEAYSRGVYPAVQSHVTAVSNLSPIALLDVAIAIILAAAGLTAFRTWRDRPALPAAFLIIVRVLSATAAIYLMFLLSWGLNYRRVPLEQKLVFDRGRISLDASLQLTMLAIQRMNAGHADAHTQSFQENLLREGLADAQRLLGHQTVAATGRPKRSLAGIYFRHAAIDGMTVPVFLEIILNPDLLDVERPSVLAHEWAHLVGYADESEASFVGWLAAVRSPDPVAQYSAWLDVYRLSMNALPRASRAALPPLAEGPQQDLRAVAARHARSSPKLRTAARGVYDSYLKANRIEEGIDNYDLALQLMLGTRFDEGWRPRLK